MKEIGNLLYGHSRGEYPFPDRDLVNSKEWNDLCDTINVCPTYGIPNGHGESPFENDTFILRPYYWGEDEEQMDLPNFHYKPAGFSIWWYKYAFRDSYMNQDLSAKEIKRIFKMCKQSASARHRLYCPYCEKEQEIEVRLEKETYPALGIHPVEIYAQVSYCKVCNQQLWNDELDDANLRKAFQIAGHTRPNANKEDT